MTPAPTQNTAARPVALSIAGSDSGGGAGIQVDLRVFHRLGAFGTTAITAITAQNLAGVRHVVGLEADSVRAQLDAVSEGFAVAAVKTGMLWSSAIVGAVADAVPRLRVPLVVDPVMVATSGARLLDVHAIAAYRERLLPLATVFTPNLDEAAVLLDVPRIAESELRAAADALFARFGAPVLLKGGHLVGEPIDTLRTAEACIAWRHTRVLGVNTHGTGCMLSAAITARLALGDELATACEHALAFVHDALARRLALAGGVALGDVEGAHGDVRVLRRVP